MWDEPCVPVSARTNCMATCYKIATEHLIIRSISPFKKWFSHLCDQLSHAAKAADDDVAAQVARLALLGLQGSGEGHRKTVFRWQPVHRASHAAPTYATCPRSAIHCPARRLHCFHPVPLGVAPSSATPHADHMLLQQSPPLQRLQFALFPGTPPNLMSCTAAPNLCL